MINFSGISIDFEELESYLKQEMLLKGICRKILARRIVDRAARDREVVVTPEEIQQEADEVRRKMRLERASDTIAWLNDSMMSAEDWEAGIRHRILTKKLAEHLFSEEIDPYFVQHRLEYDRFKLYQIIVSSPEFAQEIFYQIEEQEISFYEAAHLYDIEVGRRDRCGYEGKVGRTQLAPAIAALVENAPLAELLGPVASEKGYHLVIVEEHIPAELTPQKRQEIVNLLFKQWLDGEIEYLLHHRLPDPEAS